MTRPGLGEMVYRGLLRTLPRGFRAEYGGLLLDTFRHQRRETRYRGLTGSIRFWAVLTTDVVRTSLRLRLLEDGRVLYCAGRRVGGGPVEDRQVGEEVEGGGCRSGGTGGTRSFVGPGPAGIRRWARASGRARRNSTSTRISGGPSASPGAPSRRRVTGGLPLTRWLSGWTRDVRFSARSLRKSAGFTVVSVVTLALGIGAATAIFSLVYSVLLRPLPYQQPDQLVLFWEHDPRYQFDHLPMAPAQYLDWKRQAQPFSGMAGFRSTSVTVAGDQSEAERLRAMVVDSDLFEVLGAPVLHGRTLRPSDGVPGAAPATVIGHGLWQSRFAADPAVIGRPIDIDGTPYEVVGILPPGVRFPPPVSLLGQLYEWQTQLYLPLTPDPERRGSRSIMAVARLKPQADIDQALMQLQPLADELAKRHPEIGQGLRPVLVPLREQAVGASRQGLLMILAAVALLLLIACVNVANLQLARLPVRSREIAVLSALGASRGQVLRRLLSESLLVALAGSLAGLALAWTGLQSLAGLARNYLPDMGPVQLNAPVLLVALAAGALTGIVFGMAPALKALRLDLVRSLNQGGRAVAGGHQRLRSGLVVAEIALAVVLCIGAGLLFNSFLQLQSIDPGFSSDHATALQLLLPKGRYPQPDQIERFQSRALEELRSLPWVDQVAVSSTLPLIGVGNSGAGHFVPEGKTLEVSRQAQFVAETRFVSEGFFNVLDVPLLAGRAFTTDDQEEERPVCIINRELAERAWPGQSPLGLRLGIPQPDGSLPLMEVVGVAQNFKSGGLESDYSMAIYMPSVQGIKPFFNLLLRTARPWDEVSQTVRARLAEVDPDLPLDVLPLSELVDQAQAPRRTPTVLMGLFAAVALTLAVVGLYGVLAYLVTQRTREIGLRMALGARRPDVLRLLTLSTGRLLLAGLTLGLLAAAALASTLTGLLYQVSPLSPAVYASVAFLFALTASLASLAPALKALRVNPAQTLRSD